ncbi:hypothetical protein [Mesorhizobium sp. ZC-5]|uniref:hypothetical protein n=1 Tax=Mesorhizobium sp. ZC-5 TaxID=2986066 RepID=UPI0021E7DB35|nr:hypothetical protein [Mesorhizobium sp. ZC-5]MCV3239334.1 hypothetical protein [Mesorhizobium sp. ZC-5]
MAARKPIDTAPKDGRKVQVYWIDADGQENESIAQYRSLERLKAAGGEWDESDAGWWAFVDSDTQKRITPHSWTSGDEED